MRFDHAIIEILRERGLPVVSEYDLFKLMYDLHKAGSYKGVAFRGRRGLADRGKYRRLVSTLLHERYLRPDPDFYPQDQLKQLPPYVRVFRVSDVPDGSAEDITALADPFCYLSHMSAMQRYGLTNRIPESLNLSTPADWRVPRDAKMARDYPDRGGEDYIAPLSQFRLPAIIRSRPVILHHTVRAPEIRPIRGSEARIASIGEVFVQMLDRPELCGGMAHVLEVWTEHGPTYLAELVEAVDRAPEAIIKVRAGYIIEDVLKLTDSRVDSWRDYAQRGGSRKLDPSKPYEPVYSDKWKISLNV